MLSTIQFKMFRLLSKNTKIKIHKTLILPAALQVCVRIGLLTILIIVWRDATQSSLFIILQVHSTCFGCQPHPSSGVHKAVTTASGTGHAVLCSYLPPMWPWPRWREVVAQKNMTSTGGCSYSFMYSWWWVWLTPETCRVNLQINRLFCVASRWTIINVYQRCTEP